MRYFIIEFRYKELLVRERGMYDVYLVLEIMVYIGCELRFIKYLLVERFI